MCNYDTSDNFVFKLLPNPVGNETNTSFFCSSAAIHFFCSSFKQSILAKLSRALFYRFFQTLGRHCCLHLDHATSSSRGTNWPISMTVYLIDGRALLEQQEQWTADRRFIFLFPSSRASRSCRAPREISRSPRLRLSCRLGQWLPSWVCDFFT